MSFSYDVKNELCGNRPRNCCKKAECLGMLLLARECSERDVSLLTEHEETALRFSRLLGECLGVGTTTSIGGVSVQKLTVSVESAADREKAAAFLNDGQTLDDIAGNECCAGAFLRGAFLASGSIADPNKGYHLEFVCGDRDAAEFVAAAAAANGAELSVLRRGTAWVAYTKYSTVIEDLLTFMGATSHTLEFMNVKVYKDFRNRINRERNCDTANINKTVEAAIAQRAAIRKLGETGRLAALSDDLRDVAEKREQNPDMSLSELAELFNPPRSRAWVNRRLNKLRELGGK